MQLLIKYIWKYVLKHLADEGISLKRNNFQSEGRIEERSLIVQEPVCFVSSGQFLHHLFKF